MAANTAALDTSLVRGLGVEPDHRIEWRPSGPGIAGRLGVHALIVGVVLLAPHVVPSTQINIVSRAAVFGIIALSMNVLMGYTGQVSLGHNAFVGIGAFAAGYVLVEAGAPWLVGLVAGVLSGVVMALALGAIALRLRGLYLALVTIAFGALATSTVFNVRDFTGGGAGRQAPRPELFSGDIAYAYLCFAFLAVVWFLDWRLTSSKHGRAIEALRDDERVAASWGISITGYKLLAFVVSGAMAGLAGGLFASIEQIVSPLTFDFRIALIFVLMTVVGGLRSRPGVVIGGFIFASLPTLLAQAHRVWGEEAVCATAPPRVIQMLLGLAFAGAVAAGVAHVLKAKPRVLTARIAGGMLMVAAPIAGLWFGFGGFLGYFCVFDFITAEWEPLIGALLLLLTLTLFPGGIAQQNEHLFRWLSFKPFHPAPAMASAEAPGEGGARAHA